MIAEQTELLRHVRGRFPALASGFAFLENAGGAQVPVQALRFMERFMTDSYVQTFAPYERSQHATRVVQLARETMLSFFNGSGLGHVAFGVSTTQMLHTLAQSLRPRLKPGDEIIVSVANHEANIAPWLLLQEDGVVIKWWGVDAVTGESSLQELEGLLGDRTRAIAITQASNLLGAVEPVREAVELAHRVGALAVVDGVAHASHTAPDVADLGADFYVVSLYKIFGPHAAAMFGRTEAWPNLRGMNHEFIPAGNWPQKFELGCLPYESLAAFLGVAEYLKEIATGDVTPVGLEPHAVTPISRETVVAAFQKLRPLEHACLVPLLDFLRSRDDIRIVGPSEVTEDRHATVSFVHSRVSSDGISAAVNANGIGIRHGHMYSARLCDAMNIPRDPGVVRISAVHYNTFGEIERVINILRDL